MRLKETEKSKLSERNKELEGLLGEQKAEIKTLEQNKRKYKETSEGLKAQNRILQEEKYRYEDALKEANYYFLYLILELFNVRFHWNLRFYTNLLGYI